MTTPERLVHYLEIEGMSQVEATLLIERFKTQLFPDTGTVLTTKPEEGRKIAHLVGIAEPTTKEPRMYKVVLLNDPTTPFQVVVDVLRDVFSLPMKTARDKMMEAHTSGSSVIAVYSKDVAESKVERAAQMSKNTELRFSAEPN